MNKKTPRTDEICSLCQHETAELTYRSQLVGKGDKQVIVQAVPMAHCRPCGGTHFTRAVGLAWQEIRLHPDTHTRRKSFATASLELV